MTLTRVSADATVEATKRHANRRRPPQPWTYTGTKVPRQEAQNYLPIGHDTEIDIIWSVDSVPPHHTR